MIWTDLAAGEEVRDGVARLVDRKARADVHALCKRCASTFDSVSPGSAPGGSRTPNLLIRSYRPLDAVLDQRIRTAEPSETGRVISSVAGYPPRKSSRSWAIRPPRAPSGSGRRWPSPGHRSRRPRPTPGARPASRLKRPAADTPTPTQSRSSTPLPSRRPPRGERVTDRPNSANCAWFSADDLGR